MINTNQTNKPSAPIITAISGNTFVDLSWDTPFNGGKNITNYVISSYIYFFNINF